MILTFLDNKMLITDPKQVIPVGQTNDLVVGNAAPPTGEVYSSIGNFAEFRLSGTGNEHFHVSSDMYAIQLHGPHCAD